MLRAPFKGSARLQVLQFLKLEYPSNMLVILACSFPFWFEYVAMNRKIWEPLYFNNIKLTIKIFTVKEIALPRHLIFRVERHLHAHGQPYAMYRWYLLDLLGKGISWINITKCWGRSGKSWKMYLATDTFLQESVDHAGPTVWIIKHFMHTIFVIHFLHYYWNQHRKTKRSWKLKFENLKTSSNWHCCYLSNECYLIMETYAWQCLLPKTSLKGSQ